MSIAPDTGANLCMFLLMAMIRGQKLVAKFVTQTIPFLRTACIVQSNKASKPVNLCQERGLR